MTIAPIDSASPAQPEQPPLMVYQGQLISRDMAAAKWAELTVRPEYATAFENNDQARLTELKDYYMLARGQTPSAESVFAVKAQELDRAQLLNLQHDAVLRQYDLTPYQRHQIVHQAPVLEADKTRWADWQARAKQDQSWLKRRADKDQVALRDEYIANYVKIAPLARSQADIDAWIAAHPFAEQDRG